MILALVQDKNGRREMQTKIRILINASDVISFKSHTNPTSCVINFPFVQMKNSQGSEIYSYFSGVAQPVFYFKACTWSTASIEAICYGNINPILLKLYCTKYTKLNLSKVKTVSDFK